jgi:hypothetical protein
MIFNLFFRYNHCVQNNENGEIPEIVPTFDVNQLNFTETFVHMSQAEALKRKTTTTTTTESPEIVQALGFSVCFALLLLLSIDQKNSSYYWPATRKNRTAVFGPETTEEFWNELKIRLSSY